MNVSAAMEKILPEGLLSLINRAAIMADEAKAEIYLVGGAVRDLLLKLPVDDVDLTVNGNAIGLAEKFAAATGGKIKCHPLFNTATVNINNWKIDFAMLRAETYEKPGALPAVQPGTLETDLFRRDFTINTMAIRLNKENYGELIDLYGGKKDLGAGLIRVLHEQSFVDDATRMWRAVRYEQRLDFKIELETKRLIKRDIGLLSTVGGFRLRRELELVLQEREPEKVLVRASQLKILQATHPLLKADRWVSSLFPRVRAVNGNKTVPPDVYLALLLYRLEAKEVTQLIKYLRFSKSQEKIINASRALTFDLYDPSGTYVEIDKLLSLT